MFQVNRLENRLARLEARRFTDLRLRERDHLQEWIAATPDVLGEELLIVQKEFDGFADTRERLDLLALDKNGQLVIIENKLDDSGRDVVWQALKYAAYCSSLNKTQIVEIYQQFLDHTAVGGKAEEKICEFLDADELDEVILNAGNDQRIILIAANFRREVTAAVLWLLAHGIRTQCFRVVPYDFGNEVIVDLRQIIPMPEAEDFMISMARKESEEKTAQGARQSRNRLNQEFWTQALETLRARGRSRYENISPSKDHWLSCGSGVSGCVFSLIFLKKQVRVELSLQRAESAENKWIFDRLKTERKELDCRFGDKLVWQRLDEKKSSKISFSHPFDGYDRDIWPEMIDWLSEHVGRFEEAFSEPLSRISQQLKTGVGPLQ